MPHTRFLVAGVLFLFSSMFSGTNSAEALPPSDQRGGKPKDLNTLWKFPRIDSRSEWEARAQRIREQALVSCGLWPMPERTPLKAQVFGRVERDGYTIDKVHIQTLPGFYLAGNLYRPLGKGAGPFPGILNPHGHWANGRMADTADGSLAGRCISFARQGAIAFSYDMVGYNDTAQVNHKFASHPANQLWSISLMGLQTWNSIRALDFLESLPDVDKSRLACTGESGGGTQTFMLGAIESRLAVQAPIVMVSHSMQGGCLCENAPGLRVWCSNMEIAARPAPRPQILVAATGDWTKATMTVEGPGIESVYRLFGAADRFRYAIFDFGHNYNKTSREAVYEAFGKWLLKHSDPASLKEAAYTKEPDAALRVFPDGKLPSNALDEKALTRVLIDGAKAQLDKLKPADAKSLDAFKKSMRPAWQRTLQVEVPDPGLIVETGEPSKTESGTVTRLFLGRAGRGDRIPAVMITPSRDSHRLMAVLAHPEGKAAFLDSNGAAKGLAKKILDRGHSVLLLDAFLTGQLAKPDAGNVRNQFTSYFTTYNRTDIQERVQDLITAATFAQTHSKGRRVVLCGIGRAGLWTLLAAPIADAVVADAAGFDDTDDEALLAQDVFTPGIRRIGGFAGAAALAAPNPVLVHNTGGKLATDWLQSAYGAARASKALRVETSAIAEDELASWVASHARR